MAVFVVVDVEVDVALVAAVVPTWLVDVDVLVVVVEVVKVVEVVVVEDTTKTFPALLVFNISE